jgi:hypothetical protein
MSGMERKNSNITCPRCGYPEASMPCELCGQDGFTDFEMSKYRGENPHRFEFTLSFADTSEFEKAEMLINDGLPHRMTHEKRPRHFVFFRDRQDRELIPFLKVLRGTPGWELRVNGRPRPYTEELWLPLLDLLAVSSGRDA